MIGQIVGGASVCLHLSRKRDGHDHIIFATFYYFMIILFVRSGIWVVISAGKYRGAHML